ncbi:MAG: 50S ribosomal protein L19 [Candidatus Kaelpia aquatica]|nr:50S ribosomal protein L19 [Candidatus Kaelpia aquatica]
MKDIIREVEQKYRKEQLPKFNVGDTVKVHIKIQEGEKRRKQIFEGIVIAIGGSGIGRAFTVRKISYSEGVEKVFPFHSPAVEEVEVVKMGDVKKAKLYYLRERIGKKATRVKEKIGGSRKVVKEKK